MTALALVSAQPGKKGRSRARAEGSSTSHPATSSRRSERRRPSSLSRTRVLDFNDVSAEQIALIAHCAECEAYWLPVDEERWSAYLADDEHVRGLLDSYDLATSSG